MYHMDDLINTFRDEISYGGLVVILPMLIQAITTKKYLD